MARWPLLLGLACATVSSASAAAAAAAVGGAGRPGARLAKPSVASVAAAFRADGFRVVGNETLPSGAFAVRAASLNVTLRSDGSAKAALFVTGTHYEIGQLVAAVAPAELEAMAVEYVDRFVVALLSAKLDMELGNSSDPAVRKAYGELCAAIGAGIVHGANTSFFDDGNEALVPPELVEEMRGLADGARSRGLRNVTLARLVTLSYGMDWLSAHAYTGDLAGVLRRQVLRLAAMGSPLATPGALAAVALLREEHVTVPAHCDAVAAAGSAVVGGRPVFARGFQLPSAGTFQHANMPMIIAPLDSSGNPLTAVLGAGAPGMVGLITAVNEHGFAMGVDTLRTGDADPQHPGHASILLVRATAEAAADVPGAVEYVRSRKRGLSWLYPMTDASGRGTVLETGRWRDDAGQPAPDLSPLIQDATLRSLLPPFAELQAQAPAPYAGAGVYVRNGSYPRPDAVVEPYNQALFNLAGQPWPGDAAFAPGGLVFPNFTAEDAAWGRLASKFFSPTRPGQGGAAAAADITIVSNLALVPQLRVAEMTAWASLIPAHAAQWRFDLLSRLSRALGGAGLIDADAGRRLISFLQPCPAQASGQSGAVPAGWTSVLDVASGAVDPLSAAKGRMCTPGFWTDTIDPADPRSAVVEGSLTVADTETKTVWVKAGFWSDGWLRISLPAYLSSQATGRSD
ncbi:hypothetical protein FNF27_06471 [Cafeteria roenbergensis]|uniref:Penicillin amidase n=2 Tax=Cafeteria roenbergensis TaxID=33653 RepID=A0A5A8DZ17_CAFRO|nr:hypothetical protein FNF27_06471 [Cafeteria roenbergensis]